MGHRFPAQHTPFGICNKGNQYKPNILALPSPLTISFLASFCFRIIRKLAKCLLPGVEMRVRSPLTLPLPGLCKTVLSFCIVQALARWRLSGPSW